MLTFIVRRLLMTVPVVWIVVSLVFALIHLVPGDPVAQMLGEGASIGQVERLRHDLGLDRPIWDQYRTYMLGVVHGDLGTSFRNQQTVAKSILERYPATIELAIAATIFSILVAVPFGVIAAVRRGGTADHMVGFASLLGVSLPNFALGPLLILVFSIFLGLLPVSEAWLRRRREWSADPCWKRSVKTTSGRPAPRDSASGRFFSVMRCATV
jgi:peptide/nickel transport system permease protein